MGMVINPFVFATATPATYTTLDSRDKVNFNLSGGDLVATKSAAATSGVVSAKDGKASGKPKFEVTVTAIGADMVVGVLGATSTGVTPGTTISSALGGDAGVYSGGIILLNGTSIGASSTFTTGDVITICVDFSINRLWAAKNGVALTAGDPDAGTFGVDISSLTKALYPYIGTSGASCVGTFNFGASSFAYPAFGSSFTGWTETTSAPTFTTFRSVRMWVRSSGFFAHAFAEMELATSSGGANILTGGTPTASTSQIGGFTLAGGFDGNTSTATAVTTNGSGAANQANVYWQYDLGSNGTRNATHFAIRGRAGGGGNEQQAPTALDLFLSDDNSIWYKGKPKVSFSAFAGTTPGQRQEVAL